MFSHPRRRLARLAVVTAAGVVLAGAGAIPALAEATDGRHAVHFNLTCGGEQFSVVCPANPPRPSTPPAAPASSSVPTHC